MAALAVGVCAPGSISFPYDGMVNVFRKHKLKIADVTFAESCLTIGEVEIPHADEPIIEPELVDRFERTIKLLTPGTQCIHVVESNISGIRRCARA